MTELLLLKVYVPVTCIRWVFSWYSARCEKWKGTACDLMKEYAKLSQNFHQPPPPTPLPGICLSNLTKEMQKLSGWHNGVTCIWKTIFNDNYEGTPWLSGLSVALLNWLPEYETPWKPNSILTGWMTWNFTSFFQQYFVHIQMILLNCIGGSSAHSLPLSPVISLIWLK